LLLQSVAAYADDVKVIVKAENKEDFTTVVAAVHQQMAPGGRYEYVDNDERAKIEATLGDMRSLSTSTAPCSRWIRARRCSCSTTRNWSTPP
jgi:hypothetical protein